MKYLKVMFGTNSGADKNLEYKLGEVNIADVWNPEELDPKRMGGFNFNTETKILRWLIRGDTVYDIEVPKDAERDYRKTCFKIIKDKVNKENIDLVLSEINDFVTSYTSSSTSNNDNLVYDDIMKKLNKIKSNN